MEFVKVQLAAWDNSEYVMELRNRCDYVGLYIYLDMCATNPGHEHLAGIWKESKTATCERLNIEPDDYERILRETRKRGLFYYNEQLRICYNPKTVIHNPPRTYAVMMQWLLRDVFPLTDCKEKAMCVEALRKYAREAIDTGKWHSLMTFEKRYKSLEEWYADTFKQTMCPDNKKENESENETEKKPSFPDDSDEVRLSQLLADLITANIETFKQPNIQSWARHIDLMIRVDKRTPEDIEAVVRWCQQDSFWKSNILSTSKLRQKFDQLTAKMGGAKARVGKDEPIEKWI